jgi:membrane protease YdiL (CAAX protease family)
MRAAMLDPNSVTGRLRAMGFTLPTVLTLLVIALFKTALSEEIFFRGFLGKQLINKLGFTTGNIVQAVIFGLVHLLLLWQLTNAPMFAVIFIFFFSTLAGWTIGYIKVKYANGSIVPGWIAHGVGNTISYSIIAFVL